MARIYDALERAAREKKPPIFEEPISTPVKGTIGKPIQEKLMSVYDRISADLGEQECRMVTFLGTSAGDGSSVVAREFGGLLGTGLGKRVVLLDANRGDSGHFAHFGLDQCAEHEDLIHGLEKIEDILRPTDSNSLFLGKISNNGMAISALVSTELFHDVTQELKERFDYILVDSPFETKSADALALASKSDAVVLVVQAEVTRWQVARKLCDELKARGGKLVGVVINRRRHHIPKFIYKRL